MKKIKFTTRPNMKYLVSLIVLSFVKDIILECMTSFLKFYAPLIIVLLLFLGEFIIGGLAYLYQKKLVKKKLIKTNSFMPMALITNDKIQRYDRKWKIYLLIVIAGFFDFADCFLFLGMAPALMRCSNSLENRIRGILIIFDVLFYRYVLKLQIFKHQRFSLYVISISLIITLIIEFIFQDINIFLKIGEFVLVIFLVIIQILFNSYIDSVEKYLLEYDYVNPLKIVMLEGFVGFFMSFIYCFVNNNNPIPLIKKFHEDDRKNIFPLVLVLLVVMLILNGIQNIFRVLTNKVYSPMALALAQYFFNPIYIIFTLIAEDDFSTNKKPNYVFFSLNLILTIIISFCGCVYNEFIILFFCGLQYETYEQIALRAALQASDVELYNINNCDDEN